MKRIIWCYKARTLLYEENYLMLQDKNCVVWRELSDVTRQEFCCMKRIIWCYKTRILLYEENCLMLQDKNCVVWRELSDVTRQELCCMKRIIWCYKARTVLYVQKYCHKLWSLHGNCCLMQVLCAWKWPWLLPAQGHDKIYAVYL
jgi:hypothetical protein